MPGEVGEVGEEHGALHNVRECEALVFENDLYVFEDAFGLDFDVAADEVAGARFDRDLAGAEQHVADAHSMVIRPNSGSALCRFDYSFFHVCSH